MKSQPAKAILIVEDNPGDQVLLAELLRASGVSADDLFYAASLSAAVDAIQEKQIDIILLDLSLPDSTGLETYRLLKPFVTNLPVVILSGLADTELALQAITEGAQDYLVKDDVDEKILAKTIRYSIERKRVLEALRLSNERYNLVSKATNDMVWDWDLANNKIYRNEEQFVRILKLPASLKDSENEFWLQRIHPEDADVLAAVISAVHADASQHTFEAEYRFLCGDNTYVYLSDTGYVVRDEKGRVERIIGATRDISEKKMAEEELRKFSIIAEETVNAVILTGPDGNIEWVNEAFTRITEYALQESIGKKPGSLLQGPETARTEIDYMRRSILQQQPFTCEIVNYSKSGRKYWIKIQGQPIFDNKGRLKNYFAIETDITERKLADEALKKSEEQYRYLFDNNPACIFIWYLQDCSIAVANETAIRQYGYTRQEFLGMSFTDVLAVSELPRIKAFSEKASDDAKFYANGTWKHVNRARQEMFMQTSSHRITYNDKPAVLALALNVTDKIALENKLQEEKIKKNRQITQAVISAQEKERESIGRELHDNINQILASSRLYLGLVKNDRKEYHPCIDETDKLINSAIEEIRLLSHSLIPPSMEEGEFADALDNIIEMSMAGGTFTIEKTVGHFEQSRITDELRLTIYRIIQEQMSNIIKYAKPLRVWLKLYPLGNKIILSIKDDGIGFELAAKTTGVGLMNIKTRASLFNGELTIISAPGKGCELTVYFNAPNS